MAVKKGKYVQTDLGAFEMLNKYLIEYVEQLNLTKLAQESGMLSENHFDSLKNIVEDVKEWADKHCELFIEEMKKNEKTL